MSFEYPSLVRTRAGKFSSAVLLSMSSLLAAASAMAIDFGRAQEFDIPAQPLATALLRFSEQARVQVMVESQLVESYTTPTIRRTATPIRVLEMLLRESGLTYSIVNPDAVAIRGGARGGAASPASLRGAETRPLMLSLVSAGAELRPDVRDAGTGNSSSQGGSSTSSESRTAAPLLEEVYVTARRTSERLQDAPITIRAFTAMQLEAAGINDLSRLRDAAPGLTFFEYTDREYGQILIRGMTTQPNFDTTRELASMFIDGVYYVGTIPGISFSDIERIELVKGPQSALFGRSAFSGALNFITRTPSSTPAAEVSLRAGTHDEYEIGGSVEGPLGSEHVAGRLSGRVRDFAGDYTNSLDGRQLGGQRDENVALTLRGTFGERFSAKLRAMFQKQNDGQSSSQLLGRLASHNCGPFNGTTNRNDTLVCGVIAVPDSVAKNSATVGQALAQVGSDFGFDREFRFLSLTLDAGLPFGLSLASLSGYSEENSTILSDLDSSANDYWINQKNRHEYSFTQEVRLTSPQDGRFKWLIGAYYLTQNHLNNNRFYGGAANPFGSGASLGVNTVRRNISNRALFGAVSYQLLDTLSLGVCAADGLPSSVSGDAGSFF